MGSLAASKNVTRNSKVTAPAQKERAQRAARVTFDFSALDHIGHGVKVADPMKDVGRGIKSQPSPAEVTLVSNQTVCELKLVFSIKHAKPFSDFTQHFIHYKSCM